MDNEQTEDEDDFFTSRVFVKDGEIEALPNGVVIIMLTGGFIGGKSLSLLRKRQK